MKPYSEKYQKAVDALYYEWGVGETDEHKTRFWKVKEPNSNIYPFEVGTREWIKVFEVGHLSDIFPEDFPLC